MTATFHVGDAIEVMGKLPENSVDLILRTGRQRRGRRWYHDLTVEQRRNCLVCHVPIAVHPIRACWRET